jgi:hypothetical protein
MIIVTLVMECLLINIWMCAPARAPPQHARVAADAVSNAPTHPRRCRFYSKAVSCCQLVRLVLDSGPDGGGCPPVGPCRGFEGNCADLPAQFASVAVLPDYPHGLADFTCHAFPDDDMPMDGFIVGLSACPLAAALTTRPCAAASSLLTGLLRCITTRSAARAVSFAVALPVTLFLATCFAIANDSEAPESWLEWVGWVKLVCGLRAHRRWNYTLDKQPARFVRWYIRSIGAPFTETLANLGRSAWAWALRREPPWIVEAREAAEEEDAAEFEQPGSSTCAPSVSMSSASAHSLSTYKRAVMAAGLLGVYVTWAIFAWFIFTCALPALRCGDRLPAFCVLCFAALTHPP